MGIVCDSSTGFILPNGAIRSPDVSWIAKERVTRFSKGKKAKFLPLAPDFVLELMSPSNKVTRYSSRNDERPPKGFDSSFKRGNPANGLSHHVARTGVRRQRSCRSGRAAWRALDNNLNGTAVATTEGTFATPCLGNLRNGFARQHGLGLCPSGVTVEGVSQGNARG